MIELFLIVFHRILYQLGPTVHVNQNNIMIIIMMIIIMTTIVINLIIIINIIIFI